MAKPPKRPTHSGKSTGKSQSSGKNRSQDRSKTERFGTKNDGRGRDFRGPKREDSRTEFPRRDDRPAREQREPREPKGPKIKADLFGFHAVREAWLNPARFVHALFITESALKEFEPHIKTSAKRPAPQIVSKDDLDRAFPPGTVHQGIALSAQPLAEQSIMDLIIRGTAKERSVIVILDQVTDPHNIGAILRSACAFGADGVVMQSKHAPEMTGILAKTACGAADHIPVAYETNLSRAIEKLKENHYTVIGLDEHAEKTFGTLPKYDRAVLVLGAEGPGMRRLIREHCDVLVTLPTQKPINSLNVSNAAAVALYALLA